jgi:hypothetical protein
VFANKWGLNNKKDVLGKNLPRKIGFWRKEIEEA